MSGSARSGKIGLPSQAGRLFAGHRRHWRRRSAAGRGRLLCREGLLRQRVIGGENVGLPDGPRGSGRSGAGRSGAEGVRARQPVEVLGIGVRRQQANPPVAAATGAYRHHHGRPAGAVGDEKLEIAEPEMIDVDNRLRVMVIAGRLGSMPVCAPAGSG